MAHSPAPWRWDERIGDEQPLLDNSGKPILHIDPNYGPSEANAALISAAPELLEACKALKAWRDKNDPIHTSYFYLEKIMDKVESAIAKAEGK